MPPAMLWTCIQPNGLTWVQNFRSNQMEAVINLQGRVACPQYTFIDLNPRQAMMTIDSQLEKLRQEMYMMIMRMQVVK